MGCAIQYAVGSMEVAAPYDREAPLNGAAGILPIKSSEATLIGAVVVRDLRHEGIEWQVHTYLNTICLE